MPNWTCVFYVFVTGVGCAPLWLIWHFWHEAKVKGWAWTTVDSRSMYVDGFKTMITAAGIAVALLASAGVAGRSSNQIIGFSVKVAAICLIACICTSLLAIIALLRGHERSKSRFMEEQRNTGNNAPITGWGKLNTGELLLILMPACLALSTFLIGFVFLGRIAYHF